MLHKIVDGKFSFPETKPNQTKTNLVTHFHQTKFGDNEFASLLPEPLHKLTLEICSHGY